MEEQGITRRTTLTTGAMLPIATSMGLPRAHRVMVQEEERSVAELLAAFISEHLECEVLWTSGDYRAALSFVYQHKERFTLTVMSESDQPESTFRLLNTPAVPVRLRWPMSVSTIHRAISDITGVRHVRRYPVMGKIRTYEI